MEFAIYSTNARCGTNGFHWDDELATIAEKYNKTTMKKARKEGKQFAHIFKRITRNGEYYFHYHTSIILQEAGSNGKNLFV